MLWQQSYENKKIVNEFIPMIDIFSGQEHHLKESRVKILKWKLWKEANFFVAPTLDGAIALRDPDAIWGKGGLFIVVGPKLSPFVTST